MQNERAVSFDYLEELGLSPSFEGIKPLSLDSFIQADWIADEVDQLWLSNYEQNKRYGLARFPRTSYAKGKAVVFAGSSPAVLKQINTLKSLDQNYIIVACNAIYPRLIDEGVRVDYVFALEAHSHIVKDFEKYPYQSTLVTSPFICPKVHEVWRGAKWVYYLGGGRAYKAALEKDGINDIDIGGGNVISTAMVWAYKYLQARDFILIGTSFAYYDDGYYFDGRSTEKVGDLEAVPIKAVDMYGAVVKTTAPLCMYKTWLETWARYATDAHIINSTENGTLGVMPRLVSRGKDDFQYTLTFLPWFNIVPLTVAVEAYNLKFKEMKNGDG
jgi:hypothetical protein